MRPSAVSVLFPKLFPAVVGQKTGKGPPAPTGREPIFVGKGIDRADVADQLQRYRAKMEAKGHRSVPTPIQDTLQHLGFGPIPPSMRERMTPPGSPVQLHQEYMRGRQDVATPEQSQQPLSRDEMYSRTENVILRQRERQAEYSAKQAIESAREAATDEYRQRRNTKLSVMEFIGAGESSRLYEEPIGETTRETILRAMVSGDTLRSAKYGLNPDQFMLRLWTEHFRRNGNSEPSVRAAEFLEVAKRIADGETEFTVHPELDRLVTDLRSAVDNLHGRSYDLADIATKLMSGYGAFPEAQIVTTEWQTKQVNQILGLLDTATVVDFDPYAWKKSGADPETPFTPGEAASILTAWGDFGPRDLRQKLIDTQHGIGSVRPAEVESQLLPMQNSTQAQKLRELGTSGEKLWTNLLSHFGQTRYEPSQFFEELIGPESPRDLAIAVRQKYQPDPSQPDFQPDRNNVEFYYITRGYEGKDAPETPKISRIVYEERKPQFVEIPDDNAPGGTRWVEPMGSTTERRVFEGLTGESWETLKARVSTNPSLEISVLHDAHPVIWGGMQAIPEILQGKFTPSGYDLEPSGVVRQSPIVATKDIPFPTAPQRVSINPPARGSYVTASDPMSRLLGTMRGTPQLAHTVTPERTRAVLESLNEQDMRNVFAPGRTSDEITSYLTAKLPDSPAEAKAAARLIVATRGANRRLWNLMELRNLRAARGDLQQRTAVDIGNTDNMTQTQLDEVRRREVIKHADAFFQGGGTIESELVQRATGVR